MCANMEQCISALFTAGSNLCYSLKLHSESDGKSQFPSEFKYVILITKATREDLEVKCSSQQRYQRRE